MQHCSIPNLPNGVEIDTVFSVSDSIVHIVLKGNSTPGDEQFHIYDLTVKAAPEAFINATDTLAKNFGVTLTSTGYFIPTRIEAENFHNMYGSEIQPTSDTDSDIMIGGGKAGAYSDYKIIVPSTKMYALDFRYATQMNNKADYSILIDGVEIVRDTLESSGGWNKFKTISRNIELSEGHHTLRVYINTPWYRLNWFELNEGGIGFEELIINPINLYPNPVTDVLRFQKNINGTVQIVDITGKTVYNSIVNSNKLDASRFSPGVYQVIIEEDNKTLSVGRFVKK